MIRLPNFRFGKNTIFAGSDSDSDSTKQHIKIRTQTQIKGFENLRFGFGFAFDFLVVLRFGFVVESYHCLSSETQ